MTGLATAPRDDDGAGDGDQRNVVYLIVVGLVVLLVAMATVTATTLTGPDATASAEQAPAKKLHELTVYWKVHTGDSYRSIADRTGLTVDDLERFNPYVNPDTIRPGQQLKLQIRIPRSKPRSPRPRVHTVRSGDTLGPIVTKTRHGLGWSQALNRKLDPEALQPGDRVRLRK